MTDEGRIRKGSATGLAVGTTVVIPINLGVKEVVIDTIQISAPGLNKTTDKLSFGFQTKETVIDDIDYMAYWKDKVSHDGPWSNYMFAQGPLNMPYEDEEPSPSSGESAYRWLWLFVTSDAGNSGVTDIDVRVNIEPQRRY